MDVGHSKVVYDQVFPRRLIVDVVHATAVVSSLSYQQKRVALHFPWKARGRTLSIRGNGSSGEKREGTVGLRRTPAE